MKQVYLYCKAVSCVICRCFADAGTIGTLEESTGTSGTSLQSISYNKSKTY